MVPGAVGVVGVVFGIEFRVPVVVGPVVGLGLAVGAPVPLFWPKAGAKARIAAAQNVTNRTEPHEFMSPTSVADIMSQPGPGNCKRGR